MIKKHLLHFMTDVLLPHRSSRFHNNEVSHNKGELLEQSQCFSPTLKNIVISAPVQHSALIICILVSYFLPIRHVFRK